MGHWWFPALSGLLRLSPARCQKPTNLEEVQDRMERGENFSVYFADREDNTPCTLMPQPVFRLTSAEGKSVGVGSKTRCAMFRKVGREVFKSEFFGEMHQASNWVQTFNSPVSQVYSESVLHSIFLSRKPDKYLDSIVLSYIPPDDTEKLALFEEVAIRVLSEDSTSRALFAEGKSHVRFVAVRDKELAERLQITPEEYLGEKPSDLIVYRYHHPESVLGRFTAEDYRPLEQLQGQTTGYLKYHFAYPPAVRQLRLKLMREKVILQQRSEAALNYSSIRKPFQPTVAKSVAEMITAVSRVAPLITPLVSHKDMKMVLFPMLIDIMQTKKPLLVMSVKDSDPTEAMGKVEFRKVAERFAGRVVPVLATPRLLSHSHIKHVHLRHKQDIELRLYILGAPEYPTVSHQYRCSLPLTSSTPDQLSTWVQSCLDGKESPYWESQEFHNSPPILSLDNWNDLMGLEEGWIWVGDDVPASLLSLKNLYKLPTGVEIPIAKFKPGLYCLKKGGIAHMPGY